MFLFAIKKDSPVQTARKLDFLVFQPRSISGSNGYTRYGEPENTSRLRIPQRFVRFILKLDEHFKRSFGIGRLTYIEGAVPSDLLGREAHLGRDLRLNPGLVVAIWP